MYWDPDPVAFTIPIIQHPVRWYGVLFAVGFLLAYYLFQHIIRRVVPEKRVAPLADRLLWISIIFGVVGARLGAVFFYDWGYYSQHPEEILMTWRGGLASHGGGVGLLLGILLYRWSIRTSDPEFDLLTIMDCLAIPICVVGGLVRIGNFINQEILGVPSNLPWAVTFGHPADGGAVLPRHPAQLYESLWYFLMLGCLYVLWRSRPQPKGRIAGLFLILLFGFRVFIEMWKPAQSDLVNPDSWLWMGQLLSLPFVALGVLLLVWPHKK